MGKWPTWFVRARGGFDAVLLTRAWMRAGLTVAGYPGGMLGLSSGQLAAAAPAAGHLSAAAVRAVAGRQPSEMPAAEYNLLTDSAGELTRRVAAAMRVAAASRPVIVFLDTGEVIGDQAWGWLRQVMARTGPRVMSVIGARFETEAEVGPGSPVTQFFREISEEHLAVMSPARFDEVVIRTYLQGRPEARSSVSEQVCLIARFTRGLPLTVSIVATLLDGGQAVEQVCRGIDDGRPSEVISKLARRYLVHAETRDEEGLYPPGDP